MSESSAEVRPQVNGYIMMHRKILEWEWWSDPHVFKVFFFLIARASWEDGYWKGHKLSRGQIVASRSYISRGVYLSEQVVRTCLNKLKSTGEITIESTSKPTSKSTNGASLITITNYALYQLNDKKPTNESPNEQPENHPEFTEKPTRSKEVKKERSKETYSDSDAFKDAMDAFKEMRNKKKRPLTDRAEKMLRGRLSELATTEEGRIAILDQSTFNGWLDVYALKERNQEKSQVDRLLGELL